MANGRRFWRHALEPESDAGVAQARRFKRAAGAVGWETQFQLCGHGFSFHAHDCEGPPQTSNVVGGKKDGKRDFEAEVAWSQELTVAPPKVLSFWGELPGEEGTFPQNFYLWAQRCLL